MKLKYNFIISEVAGQTVAVPVGCEKGEQNIIKTNETGAFILELLKNDISENDICAKIKENFKVEDVTVLENWVFEFIKKLKSADLIINE